MVNLLKMSCSVQAINYSHCSQAVKQGPVLIAGLIFCRLVQILLKRGPSSRSLEKIGGKDAVGINVTTTYQGLGVLNQAE